MKLVLPIYKQYTLLYNYFAAVNCIHFNINVFTFNTFTLNISSIAFAICTLVALVSTLKVYLPSAKSPCTFFSYYWF